MTYEALATRLRPRRFADVVGQDATVRILQAAVRLGRVVPSYVFSGPPGSGKTTVARLFAAALNCTGHADDCPVRHGASVDCVSIAPCPIPCGSCPSCLDIREGRHPLVIEVDAASDRGVEMVESIQQVVAQVLAEGTWRIFILDEAHMLSGKAWAAFLKTIEEPVPHNVFLFVTTDRDKVLTTVRSRSSAFIFRAVAEDAIVRVLAAAARDAQLDPSWQGEFLTADVLALIAREARGSVRDALHLLDRVALLGPSDIRDVEQVLGFDSESIRDLADALLSRDLAYYVRVVTDVMGRGFTAHEIADAMLRVGRDLVVFRTGWRGAAMSHLPADKLVANASHLADGTIERLYRGLVQLVEGRVDRIALDTMYARFVWEEKSVDTFSPTK